MQSSKKTARRDKKAFFNEQCLIIEGNNEKGMTRDLFRKAETSREHSTQRWAQ